MPSVLGRRWMVLDWLLPDCLRAQDIPYSEVESVKDAIDAAAGGGITPAQHEVLDTLVHDLSEDAYTEYTRVSGRVTNITVWTDNGKTLKIRETDLVYTSGRVTQEVIKQYDGAGDLAVTKTIDYTRTSGKVTSEDITVVYA